MPATKAPQRPRWFTAWRNSARAAAGPDAADMGTAFGLEQSLLDNAPEVPAPPRRGWLQRLARRRSEST